MQSKDLRIGNLVKGNSRGGTHILDIGILKYIDETKSGYSPIPLNEYWFTELGFKRHHFDYIDINTIVMFKQNYDDKGDEDGWIFKLYPEELGSATKNKCEPIRYVHELQNLYFALTREELELKHESKP